MASPAGAPTPPGSTGVHVPARYPRVLCLCLARYFRNGYICVSSYSAELSTDNPVPSDSSLWVDVLADSLSTGSSNGFMCWIMLDGALRCNGDNTFGMILAGGPTYRNPA